MWREPAFGSRIGDQNTKENDPPHIKKRHRVPSHTSDGTLAASEKTVCGSNGDFLLPFLFAGRALYRRDIPDVVKHQTGTVRVMFKMPADALDIRATYQHEDHANQDDCCADQTDHIDISCEQTAELVDHQRNRNQK